MLGPLACDGFDNADRADLLGRLKGVVLYEGVNATLTPVMPDGVPTMFLYANSNVSESIYDGQSPPTAIANFLNSNHFGINDWVEKNALKQFGRCNIGPDPSDLAFSTTRHKHERALRAIAHVTTIGFKTLFEAQTAERRVKFARIVRKLRETSSVEVKIG